MAGSLLITLGWRLGAGNCTKLPLSRDFLSGSSGLGCGREMGVGWGLGADLGIGSWCCTLLSWEVRQKWTIAPVLSFGYNKVRARSWLPYDRCLRVTGLWGKWVLDFTMIAQGNDQVIPTLESPDASCHSWAGLLGPVEDSPERKLTQEIHFILFFLSFF